MNKQYKAIGGWIMEKQYKAVIVHPNGCVDNDESWMDEHYPECDDPNCCGCYEPAYDKGDHWIDVLLDKYGVNCTITVYQYLEYCMGWTQINN